MAHKRLRTIEARELIMYWERAMRDRHDYPDEWKWLNTELAAAMVSYLGDRASDGYNAPKVSVTEARYNLDNRIRGIKDAYRAHTHYDVPLPKVIA